MIDLLSTTLLSEYEVVIKELGNSARDERIIAKLVRDNAWTEHGAREVLYLARRYGTSILRNALALAAAMQIEDGESGL